MNNASWVAMTGLCVLLGTSAAQADLITIDAGGHAAGTEVSNAFDGLTLSHVTFSEAGRQSSGVYTFGAAAFGWQKASGKSFTSWNATSELIVNCLQQNHSYCYSQPQHLLEVSFEQATDFVRFDASQVTDSPWAWAFDAAGNLLALTPLRSLNEHGVQQSVSLSSAAGNISRILIAGNDGYSIVNRLSYNNAAATPAPSVPEPETLALMMVGLLGVAVTARTRRRPSR